MIGKGLLRPNDYPAHEAIARKVDELLEGREFVLIANPREEGAPGDIYSNIGEGKRIAALLGAAFEAWHAGVSQPALRAAGYLTDPFPKGERLPKP